MSGEILNAMARLGGQYAALGALPDDWFGDDEEFTPSAGVWHTMATDDGRLVCCGRDAVSIPVGDGMTADPQRITCAGVGVAL